MKKLLLIELVAAIVALLAATSTQAHYFTGTNAVDAGKNIHARTYTTYTGARDWAMSHWGVYSPIKIGWDTGSTYADLDWRDYSDCSSPLSGVYHNHDSEQPGEPVDHVHFNKCNMEPRSTYRRQAIAVHELGHALGLGHNPDSTQIMYSNPGYTNVPESHDVKDYHELWGY